MNGPPGPDRGFFMTKTREFPMAQYIQVRFYEELNDHLPQAHRKRDIFVAHVSGMTAGSLIRQMGVDPCQVDLVLVNGRPSEFSRPLASGDRVSVYPVFERLDIGPVSLLPNTPLRRPAFAADVHLGKLAKYLRMAGFDTFYDNGAAGGDLAALAESRGRIFLTRSGRSFQRQKISRLVRVPMIRPVEQLAFVVKKLQLENAARPFSRCLICNQELLPARGPGFLEKIPEHFAGQRAEAAHCPQCGRVYWKGTHYMRMKRMLASVFFMESSDIDENQEKERDL